MKKLCISLLIAALFLGACSNKKDETTDTKTPKVEEKKETKKEETVNEEKPDTTKEATSEMNPNERNPEMLKIATEVTPSSADMSSIKLLSGAWVESTFAVYGPPAPYSVIDWQTVDMASFIYLSGRIVLNNDMRVYNGGTYVGDSGNTYQLLPEMTMSVVDKDVLSKYSEDYLGVDILSLDKINDPDQRKSFDYIASLEGYRIFHNWPVGGVPGIQYLDGITAVYNYKDTYIVEGRAITGELGSQKDVKTYLFLHKVSEGDFNLMWGFLEY